MTFYIFVIVKNNVFGIDGGRLVLGLFYISSMKRLFIHVINFKEESGRFFFHFLEVFEKCIGYIRIFFIHFLEVSKFW